MFENHFKLTGHVPGIFRSEDTTKSAIIARQRAALELMEEEIEDLEQQLETSQQRIQELEDTLKRHSIKTGGHSRDKSNWFR